MLNRRNLMLTLAAGALPACRSKSEPDLAEVINIGDEGLAPQLLRGFHRVEANSWRWTQGKFSVALKPPKRIDRGAVLLLRFSVPDAVMTQRKEITLSAVIEGVPLPPEKITTPGAHEFRRDVPAEVVKGKRAATVDFTVDPFTPPGEADERELGIIAETVGLLKKS
jgi:hypothetical protein